MQNKTHTLVELEELSEIELDDLATNKGVNDARFVLGKLMVEGSSPKVPLQETKGVNWIREAAKRGSIDALEYKTYWEIRFDKAPNLNTITKALEQIVAANKSPRACNTLAEINHAQAGERSLTHENPEVREAAQAKAVQAAKYYLTSAEQGDIIGMHWMGVFMHEGFGVSKNLEKAVEYLSSAGDQGNGQSLYQLYLIHSGNEGQESNMANVQKAYNYLIRAIQLGVTFFDEAISYFKKHFDVLAPTFISAKKLTVELNEQTKKDVLNMYDAWINELKTEFSSALSKDRLYHKPCGFLNDQQIWMLGVQAHYLVQKVLHFSHADFIKAIKFDLGPVLGNTGIWSLKCWLQEAKEAVNTDLKKKLMVALELVEKFQESGLDVLNDEKKYNFINKFGPKKLPDQAISRSSIRHLYSWQHYAPLQWYEFQKKQAEQAKAAAEGKSSDLKFCNSCQSAEGTVLKHKICSACKAVFYCSVECQKHDWKEGGHKDRCKELQKRNKK